MIADWVEYNPITGEFINKHTGVIMNMRGILNTDGSVRTIGTGTLICGEGCIYKMKYLVCIEKVARVKGVVLPHEGDHRDKHGITWPNEECIRT